MLLSIIRELPELTCILSQVAYEIWPKSFKDSTGDGHGDIQGRKHPQKYTDLDTNPPVGRHNLQAGLSQRPRRRPDMDLSDLQISGEGLRL